MLGDTTYEFESSEIDGRGLGALSEKDFQRLLTVETTTVDVRQGDELLLPKVDGRQCEITRPRVRTMHPSTDPADRYLELRFGVTLIVQSDQIGVTEPEDSPLTPTPRRRQTGSDGPAHGDIDDAATSVEDATADPGGDVPEDDTADEADGANEDEANEVETKHVLTEDGIEEVPVDADETENDE